MFWPSLIHRWDVFVGMAIPTDAAFPSLPVSDPSPQAARERDRTVEMAAATVVRARMLIVPHWMKGSRRNSAAGCAPGGRPIPAGPAGPDGVVRGARFLAESVVRSFRCRVRAEAALTGVRDALPEGPHCVYGPTADAKVDRCPAAWSLPGWTWFSPGCGEGMERQTGRYVSRVGALLNPHTSRPG